MPAYQYTCNHCDEEFEHKKKDKKFCSSKCYYSSKKKTVIIKCKYCNTEREMAYRFRAQQYCSKACSNSATKSKVKKILTCKNCSIEYSVKQSRGDQSKFCSYDCFLDNTRGGLGPIIIKQCKNCKEDFDLTFIKRNQQFCSKSCATSGEFNAMSGKTGELNPMFGKKAWNNGQTINTDYRVKLLGEKISKQMKEKFKTGELSNAGKNNPNYGRTRDTRTQEQLDNYSRAAIKRIKSSNAGFMTGYHFSDKIKIRMKHRSSYEKRMMICLDADDNVITYDYESVVIKYGKNKNVRYLVDFDVKYKTYRKLIEVKAKDFLDDPIVLQKEAAAIRYCKNRNSSYEFYTLKEIEEYERKLGIKNED
jgi:hypothetical protein